MKIYSIKSVSNYSNKIPVVKNTVKSDSIIHTYSNNSQNVSFGNGKALKLFAGAGLCTLGLICPEAVAVAGLSFLSSIVAYKLTEQVKNPEEQKTIAENGKNIMEDIIRDSYPY